MRAPVKIRKARNPRARAKLAKPVPAPKRPVSRGAVPAKPHGETSGRGFTAVRAVQPNIRALQPGAKPGVRAHGRAGAPGQLKKVGGFDPGKFASEVSGNFAKGVAQVGKSLDRSPGVGATRAASRAVPSGAQSKKNNDALKKALGRN